MKKLLLPGALSQKMQTTLSQSRKPVVILIKVTFHVIRVLHYPMANSLVGCSSVLVHVCFEIHSDSHFGYKPNSKP